MTPPPADPSEIVELDDLDRKAAAAFPGHLVRKDLVTRFRGQFPVPTYVVEFMLGRYCATTDPEETEEGATMVQEQLSDRTVRAVRRSCLRRAPATAALCA
jgi:ATP-dependent Lon protease